MQKFPDDVKIAEDRVGGDVNILNNSMFLPPSISKSNFNDDELKKVLE